MAGPSRIIQHHRSTPFHATNHATRRDRAFSRATPGMLTLPRLDAVPRTGSSYNMSAGGRSAGSCQRASRLLYVGALQVPSGPSSSIRPW